MKQKRRTPLVAMVLLLALFLIASVSAGLAAVLAAPAVIEEYGITAEENGITQEELDAMAIDPQSWRLQEHMTWDEWKPNPAIDWEYWQENDAKLGDIKRPLKGMLILVDFPDRTFISSEPLGSELIGNPLVSEPDPKKLGKFWCDFLNTPSTDNNYTTLNGYWLENSFGDWSVELDACGPYTASMFEFQYGFYGSDATYQAFQTIFPKTNRNTLGAEAYAAAKEEGIRFFKPNEAGTDRDPIYDFVFILHAGYDQSGSWQEMGEMMFQNQTSILGVPVGEVRHPITGKVLEGVSGYDFTGEARVDLILDMIRKPGFDLKAKFPNFYLYDNTSTQNDICGI